MNPRSANFGHAPLQKVVFSLKTALTLAAAFAFSCFVFSNGSQSRAFAFSPSKYLTGPTTPIAANYCVSCHDAQDARLTQAADWRGSPAVTPAACPGLRAEDEQLYYAERPLHALHRLDPNAAALPSLYAQYTALLDVPRDSADAFTGQAQLLNYKAGKAYAALTQSIESGKRLRALIAALLVTAFLLFAFGWGLRNTLRYRPAKGFLKTYRPGPRTVGVLGVVVILCALPLFRTPTAAVATATAEDQAVQTELDKSSRAGSVAERSLGRAWMLGQIAATWAQVDLTRGEQILAEALAAEATARTDADALWGRSEAAREAAIGSVAGQDEAALVSEELRSVRNRAWALRLIATEWAAVDAARARDLLAQAEAVARANPTIYGQVDIAALAATWQRLDSTHVMDVPAFALAEANPAPTGAIAETLARYQVGDYTGAWDASLGISDEWERSRAQAAIAAGWNNADAASRINIPPLRDWAMAKLTGTSSALQLPDGTAEALTVIDKLATEADKAEALRTLAVRTGDAEIFERALKMAAAARVRGDSLAPSRASLALARALLEKGGSPQQIEAALAQAYDLTVKISVKYK